MFINSCFEIVSKVGFTMKREVILAGVIFLMVMPFISGCTDEKDNGGDTSEINVDIEMSVDKTMFGLDEQVNITVTVRNNMSGSFPFGSYSLELGYVNKSDYDSGGAWSMITLSDVFVDSINVSAGDTYKGNVSWDTSSRYVYPGEYYIRFEIHEDMGSTYTIKDAVSIKITFV